MTADEENLSFYDSCSSCSACNPLLVAKLAHGL